MPGGQRHVLDCDWQAVQRTERLALHDGVFRAPRRVARLVGGEGHDRVELRVEPLDRLEVRIKHLDRADGAGANEPRSSSRAGWRASVRSPADCSGDAGGVLLADVDNGDHGPPACGSLVHRVDGDEHGGIADRRRGDAADRGLRMAMMMHVGIIQHDLAATAQRAAPVGLAFHEAVDHPPA